MKSYVILTFLHFFGHPRLPGSLQALRNMIFEEKSIFFREGQWEDFRVINFKVGGGGPFLYFFLNFAASLA